MFVFRLLWPKMKFFQSIQRIFLNLGIVSNQSMQTRSINAIYLLIYLLTCIFLSIFLFYEANNIEEYMDGGFLLTISISIMFCYTILLVKMEKIFDYIDSAEKIVEQSEYKPKVYSNWNTIRSSRLINWALNKKNLRTGNSSIESHLWEN